MPVQLRYEKRDQDWKDAAKAIEGTIFGAARGAFQDLAVQVQGQARAEIAGVGFKGKWVTGFRTYVFPRTPGENDITQLTMRGFHSYNIANVFERGANVAGNPLLWVPLATAPNSVKGKPTTPARLIAAGVRLHKIDQGGKSLLIGNIIRPSARSKKRTLVRLARGRFVQAGQVTVAQLLNAQRNIRRTQTRRAFGVPNPYQTVPIPLFVGLRAIEIKKKFNISAIYEQGRADLPDFYNQRLAQLIFGTVGKRFN